jgi:starvation-inducible DNA-binding protein
MSNSGLKNGPQKTRDRITPIQHQKANSVQKFGTVIPDLPLGLIAERIQILGGVSVAMAHDVAEMTRLESPPRDREEVPVQISRLLEGHKLIIEDARKVAKAASEKGDEGTNDLLISDVVRTNEMQVWFVSEHTVDMPLIRAE